MFQYSSNDTVIPTLTFTKAELAYVLAFLTSNISLTDNSSQIEMVEVRHFLNLNRDRVDKTVRDGSLLRSISPQTASETPKGKDVPPENGKPHMPSMSELKASFPTLSEEEIRDILEKAKSEQSIVPQQSPPSFIKKTSRPPLVEIEMPHSKEEEKKRENSRKFASMLGALA